MIRIYKKKGKRIEIDSSCVEFKIEEGYIQISLTAEKKLCIRKTGFNAGDQINIAPNCSNQVYIS